MVTDPCSGNILQCGPRNNITGLMCRDVDPWGYGETLLDFAQMGSEAHTYDAATIYWDGLTCVLWPRPRYQQNARVDSQRPTRARAQV